MDRRGDLDRFYRLIGQLEALQGGNHRLDEPDLVRRCPAQGLYFFFEPGEYRADGKTPRVVRVGTHGGSDGARSSLWGRLRQHRGSMRSGRGNHRGSIFRLHVGVALQERSQAFVPSWGTGAKDRVREAPLEALVSQYIGKMEFLWLSVPGEAGKENDRRVIERGAIGLLSGEGASAGWLGRWSNRPAIRGSGLWNVNHVDEGYEPGFLDVMERYVGLEELGRAASARES